MSVGNCSDHRCAKYGMDGRRATLLNTTQLILAQFVGRFFIGWAVGSLSAVVPLYDVLYSQQHDG